MTDMPPSFSGEVMLLDWSETAKGGAKIVLQLDGPEALDPFRNMTLAKRGTAGQRLMAVMVEIGEDETPKSAVAHYVETGEASQDFRNNMARGAVDKIATVETKPFGKQASELYRTGFFFVPAVLEAIGTDAEFLDWIRAQPCAVTGERDYHKDEAAGIVTERCDPAHVRTVANGAGTGIKPPYCAIPLVHHLHDLETRHGKAALYQAAMPGSEWIADISVLDRVASEWMNKLRDKYVVAWARTTLAKHFGKPSMGYVDPSDVLEWAHKYALEHFLPAAYK